MPEPEAKEIDWRAERCGHNFEPQNCPHEHCGYREALAGAMEDLEAILAVFKAASDERWQFLQECYAAAEKCKAEGGDWCGWNFHMGRSAGGNECDIMYFKVRRALEEAIKKRGVVNQRVE